MKTRCILLAIFLFAVIFPVCAQITIKGTVFSKSDNLPIPGVYISIKGTTTGAISDLAGKYSINVPDSQAVLVYTCMGFVTQETEVKDKTIIDIFLEHDETRLEEVVVVGYGIQRRASVTGACSSISSESIVPASSGAINPSVASLPKSFKTWKRTGSLENSVRLSIGDGDNDYIPLVGTHMDVKVDGFRARVVLDYYFYSKMSRAEGTFKIHLPTGASPYYFAFGPTVYLNNGKQNHTQSFNDYYEGDSIFLNKERITETQSKKWKQPKEAKIVPTVEALYAYTESVRGRVDPMIAEWAGADVFNCRVFPIEQNQMHRVVIAYDVNLTNIGNDKVFDLCIPKSNSAVVVDMDIAKIYGVETIISQKKGLDDIGDRIKIHIDNPEKEEITIRYQNPENMILLDKQEKYFASSLRVDLPSIETGTFSHNAVFMLDVSASSNPDKFNIWLKLMKAVLENNPDEIKQFNVLFFNIETYWYKNEYVENNEKNRKAFFAFCDQISLEGATDIGAALSQACKPDWEKRVNNKNIFFLSDGSITWGEQNLYSISKDITDNSRIFVYNTGISGTDMNLMEHLSRESGGAMFSVTGEDEIAQASTAFKFQAWKITSLKIAGCKDLIIEGRPKYLFAGQKIILAGRGIPARNAELELKAENEKRKEMLTFSFPQKLVSEMANRIYGQIAVNQLESFDFFTEKNSVAYSKYFRVPGKTCSMLMLETQNDYDRYKIDLKEDSSLVNESSVNSIVNETILKIGNSEGTEKDKFLNQLKYLSNAPNTVFTLSDSLKSLINKIPASSFRIIPSKLECKRRFKEELSKDLLDQLTKDELKFYIVENEADEIETKYGAEDALKILSTIIERNPGNGNLIRDVAYSAMRLGLDQHAYFLFKQVMERIPNEPHAYLALAQILSDMNHPDLALLYYEIAYTTNWNGRFGDTKSIVGLDYLRFLRKLKHSKSVLFASEFMNYRLKDLESSFRNKNNRFKLDNINLMVSITWNTDNSDIDLHVNEPSGEECYYSHQNTNSGGCLTYDVTQGYGPEMYINPANLKGKYDFSVHYFSDVVNRATTRSQVYVILYENWGKPNEKITRKVVSLKDRKDTQLIASLFVGKLINQ